MSARILPFKAAPPTAISARLKALERSGPVLVEIPTRLAQRIADAAIWGPKTPEQFVIDLLQAEFPEKTGAA